MGVMHACPLTNLPTRDVFYASHANIPSYDTVCERGGIMGDDAETGALESTSEMPRGNFNIGAKQESNLNDFPK